METRSQTIGKPGPGARDDRDRDTRGSLGVRMTVPSNTPPTRKRVPSGAAGRTRTVLADAVAAGGAALAFVSLFMPWYRFAVPLGSFGTLSGLEIARVSALRAGGFRFVAALAAAAAAGMAIARMTTSDERPGIQLSMVTYLVCGSAVLLTVAISYVVAPSQTAIFGEVGDLQDVTWMPYYGMAIAAVGAIDLMLAAVFALASSRSRPRATDMHAPPPTS